MKKFAILTVVLLFGLSAFGSSYIDRQLKETKKNVKYNTVDKQIKDNSYADELLQIVDNKVIKDPKLIKLDEFEKVSEKDYKLKIKNDNEIYDKEIFPALNKRSNSVNIEPHAVDFYRVYRIAERIIRANNLQHQNWRIAIRKTDDVNAYASNTSLVVIYTGLYDSIYTNEDALAFVIAHEMAHNLLGHSQRRAEMNRVFESIKAGAVAKVPVIDPLTASVKILTSTGAFSYKIHLYKEYRMMEYMADSEGMNMIIKAGYSPSNALYTLDFLHSLTELKQLLFRSHPMTDNRVQSVNETIYFADPNWVEEGKYNIYKSHVLPVKKSSDRVSIVISNDSSVEKYYAPETYEKRLTRLAYVSYTKGDMKNAIKYFEKLNNIDNSYVNCLYLSYANEYLYKQSKDIKYKKDSLKYAKLAKKLNGNDVNVNNQIKDIERL